MTDHPEFRPIESAPTRRVWPYALLGAALVAGLVFTIAHRSASAPATAKPAAEQTLANLAPKIDGHDAAASVQGANADATPAQARAAQGPNVIGGAKASPQASQGANVIGGAMEKVKSIAASARGEVDREIARSKGAQKQVALYKKQNAELQKELDQARAQISAMQQAKKGPPPSDQEQILQMLAPVLRTSSNDGRP